MLKEAPLNFNIHHSLFIIRYSLPLHPLIPGGFVYCSACTPAVSGTNRTNKRFEVTPLTAPKAFTVPY
jgi:hypothetical protein